MTQSKQELVAAPKLGSRGYLILVGVVTALLAGVCLVRVITGGLAPTAFAGTLGVIVAIALANVVVYRFLLGVAERTRPERKPLVGAAMAGTVLFGVLAPLYLAFRGTVLGTAFLGNFWMIVWFVGFTVAAGGWGRRVGESLHCPKCDYEFRFDDAENAPKVCPECGTPWIGKLIKGRRVRSLKLVAIGAAVVVGSYVVFNPVFYMGALAPHLPTPVLCAAVYAAPRSGVGIWDEVALRTVSPWWTGVLAERVLSQRIEAPFDDAPCKWFLAMAGSGRLSADQVERYYSETFRASVVAPGTVKVGEAFTVSLSVSRIAATGNTFGIMFAGYGIDDGAPLAGRVTKTVWAHELRPQPYLFTSTTSSFPATLALAAPGKHSVRAVFWVIHQQSFTEQLVWQADGTPVTPVGATRFEKVEMEAVVEVR